MAMVKKSLKPGVEGRYIRLYGAISADAAKEAKNDAEMERMIKIFRAIYSNDGRKAMAEARERAAARLINTDYTD